MPKFNFNKTTKKIVFDDRKDNIYWHLFNFKV